MASETAKKIDEVDARHQTSDPAPHHSLRKYYMIFAWLMILLVLTVLASLIPFDRLLPGLNAIVALLIASVKGALVVLFFMHVKEASKLTWAFATAAFLWLVIMFVYTFSDYYTRESLPNTADRSPPAMRAFTQEHTRGVTPSVSDRD